MKAVGVADRAVTEKAIDTSCKGAGGNVTGFALGMSTGGGLVGLQSENNPNFEKAEKLHMETVYL